jgi:tRNA U34 2-thiouridine synthase MnmA/TrmU
MATGESVKAEERRPIKAVGLMSGGLDSTLAAGLLRAQGVEVIGLNFSTGFCVTDHRRAIGHREEDRHLRNEALRAGADTGVEVRIIDVADEYIEMVKHPRHGYGLAANPCIDCRIFMLNKAREIADAEGAEVIFTGGCSASAP